MMDTYSGAAAELPATDQSALDRLQRFGGPKLLGEMIALFLVAAPERIEAARTAGAEGDVEGAERALHSLKSSAAQLGAMRMQRISEQGEHRARAGTLDGLAPLIEELEQELARVKDWLTTTRDQGAA
jgi:HPt (histidine-containing phosphotransfer) domain-containing protein